MFPKIIPVAFVLIPLLAVPALGQQGVGRLVPPTSEEPGFEPPELLKKTIVPYTKKALRAKVEGKLVIQTVVRKDGSVDDFKFVKALGRGLEEAAIKEIVKREFRPARRDGEPVDVYAKIEVEFTLGDQDDRKSEGDRN